MKPRLLLFALLLILGGVGHAFAQTDTAASKAKLVNEYFSYVSMNKMIDEMAQEVAKQLPADQRQPFVEMMTKHVRTEVLEAAAKESLGKHLTVAELKALVEFMKKPEARSAMDKMKYYMADLMPVMQQELARAMQMTQPAK